ncbi:MAG TPA: hypothetical protein VET65_00965 [Candidatus Limnocylindrales bacterium]|nr:hypothetical protein [Candidatus Limnocylindrales bacterium]
METSPRAYSNEAERRGNLRRLDDLLEALERLNLADATDLPPTVRERLEREGIAIDPGVNFSRLIELVWAQQEKYLIDVKADRRKGARRAGDAVISSHRVLDAFLMGRLTVAQRRRRRLIG